MAQTLARLSSPAAQRQQLRLEKVGVIAGFLTGLALAGGVVSGALVDVGAPQWLEFAGLALTVALTTRLGLSAAATLSRKLAD
jgi:fatty acid desaturase